MIWGLFALIHKMVQDLDDITQGTIAVVKNSQAKYLEIRTTPKAMADKSRDDYIDAFEAGLNATKMDEAIEKTAYCLLSLDRAVHTVDDAADFIRRILTSRNRVLVGLDISGNPLGTRTLSDDNLAMVVTMALESGVNIAIHMGESNTDIEKQDTNAVLNALEQWGQKQPNIGKNPFFGKVRLGHCIYLTQKQQEKIHALGLPIEVCPTCHKKVNWHLEETPHPVSSVYSDINQNLVVGTDDDAIFGGSMDKEFNDFLRFFKNESNLSRKELKTHQSQFRFEM